MSSVSDIIKNAAKTAGQTASNVASKVSQKVDQAKITARGGNQNSGEIQVEEIGKPFKFDDLIDPQERSYRFLVSRMNVVDIYPCTYAQSYLYTDQGKSLFRWGLGYEMAMKRYRKMCTDYLSEGPIPSGVRIFLTDDTTTADGVQTQYKENFFQKLSDSLSNALQGFTSMSASLGSGSPEAISELLSDINTDKVVGAATSGLNLGKSSRDLLGNIVDGLKQGAKIILKGNKISLPKIWQASSYTNTFTVSTKLIAPYGSPKAVKKYIVRPIILILLLGLPHSDDMVSYGRPFAVTVRSWGNALINLAGITSVTLQRGGPDSVYNLYHQPLVVNVNIEFASIVDGVMAYEDPTEKRAIDAYEKLAYPSVDQIKTLNSSSQYIDGSILPTVVPTLGSIIRSFRPVQMSGINYGYGPQQSTRDDVMIGGNGGGGGFSGGGAASGILSPFGQAFAQANSGAQSQNAFTQLLNGVASTASGIAGGVGAITGALNGTLGAATNLANMVSGGAFGQTGFGRSLNQFQSRMNAGNRAVGTIAGATTNLAQTVNAATNFFGGLFNTKP